MSRRFFGLVGLVFGGAIPFFSAEAGLYGGVSLGGARQTFNHHAVIVAKNLDWMWGTEGSNWSNFSSTKDVIYGVLAGYFFSFQKLQIGPEGNLFRGLLSVSHIGSPGESHGEAPFVRAHSASRISWGFDLSLRLGYEAKDYFVPFCSVGFALGQIYRKSYVLDISNAHQPQLISGTYFDQKSWQPGFSASIGFDYKISPCILRFSYGFVRYSATNCALVRDTSQSPPDPIYSDQVKDLDQHRILFSVIIPLGKI